MGPVHAVLSNSDLLAMIFPPKTDIDENDHKELFRLALVCRKFSAVALDILWNTVYNMEHVYCLFPGNIVSTDPENTQSFNRTPVTHDQWARFDSYAWRIRKIVSFLPDDHDIYMVLGRHPTRRHPFPHLTCLRWSCDISSLSHAALMMCATLADVSFYLYDDGPDDAMAGVIQAVKENCTYLREFEYVHYGKFIPTSTTFETCLVSFIRSSIHLRMISVPINYRVLDALALLPSLTQIIFTEPRESSGNGWNGTYSVGRQSPNQETFVALEQLNIRHTFTSIRSMNLFLERFRKIESNPRVHLNVTIDSQDPRSFDGLPRQLYDALPANLRIGLAELRLYQNWEVDAPPVYSWQSFSWLLTSPRLQVLRLYDLLLEIDDAAFAQTAQKWPELQTLSLSISHISVHPHTTFRGLAHLSLLPKLQDLSLTIGPNCTILPSSLYSKKGSTSPLCNLELRGEFPNADTLSVALFLAKHFPNLQTLRTLHAQPQPQWAEVKAKMKFLREVIPEIPDGRARLTSDR